LPALSTCFPGHTDRLGCRAIWSHFVEKWLHEVGHRFDSYGKKIPALTQIPSPYDIAGFTPESFPAVKFAHLMSLRADLQPEKFERINPRGPRF